MGAPPATRTLVFARIDALVFLADTPIDASLAPYVSDFDGALAAATYRPDVFAIPPPENDAPNHTLEEAMKHSSAGR